jgi:hypothetical protein
MDSIEKTADLYQLLFKKGISTITLMDRLLGAKLKKRL